MGSCIYEYTLGSAVRLGMLPVAGDLTRLACSYAYLLPWVVGHNHHLEGVRLACLCLGFQIGVFLVVWQCKWILLLMHWAGIVLG
jgi:hypothetical protein